VFRDRLIFGILALSCAFSFLQSKNIYFFFHHTVLWYLWCKVQYKSQYTLNDINHIYLRNTDIDTCSIYFKVIQNYCGRKVIIVWTFLKTCACMMSNGYGASTVISFNKIGSSFKISCCSRARSTLHHNQTFMEAIQIQNEYFKLRWHFFYFYNNYLKKECQLLSKNSSLCKVQLFDSPGQLHATHVHKQ
jgi:hypothetical protein